MEKVRIWLSGIIDKIIYDNKKGFIIFSMTSIISYKDTN